tara:strand:+ start:3827 stop:4156 length:330 start_codon:yes stop_codon:yes gene_type:complete
MEFIITKDKVKKVSKRKFIEAEFYSTNKIFCEWCKGNDLVLVALKGATFLAYYIRLSQVKGHWSFSDPKQVLEMKKYRKLKNDVSLKMKCWLSKIEADCGYKINKRKKL